MTNIRWVRVPVLAAAIGIVATVAGWVALERFHLPRPTGPYPVGTRALDLTDRSRHEEGSSDPNAKREIVVQLWYPAEASSKPLATYARWSETSATHKFLSLIHTNSRLDAPVAHTANPFPVLLFGPRWDGERTQNTDLAEELASHGYVVAAIDHPYNASRVQLGNGQVIAANPPLEGPKGDAATADERIAYWNATLDVWAADDLFALNQLARLNREADSPLHSALDTEHVGAFGHSFGGAASLRLCGVDPRVKAAANLDGWTFGALASRTAAQPVMLLYERSGIDRRKELETAPYPGTVDDQLDRADDAAIDASLKKFGGYRLYIAGTQHLDFSDQPLLPAPHRGSFTGPIAPERMQTILRTYLLGFFDQTLRGKDSRLLDSPHSPFPEVTPEIWPTPAPH